MKKLLFLVLVILFTGPSIFAQKANQDTAVTPSEYYACAMHNQITSHVPGKCSICGSELSLTSKEKMNMSLRKKYSCPAHLDVVSHDPGKCPKCGKKLNFSTKEQMKSEVTKVYTCTMHPEVALNKDGVCPKCGKDLFEMDKIDKHK